MDDFVWLQKYHPNNGNATKQEKYPGVKILETRPNKADGTVSWRRLRMDDKGGADYKVISTTQMLPMPYALYAEKAGTVVNGGGSGSASEVNDFVLIPERESSGMPELFSGTTLTIETSNFHFRLFILYLTCIIHTTFCCDT